MFGPAVVPDRANLSKNIASVKPRPDLPGLSENIKVRSIVGRFLEHSRIFYFHAEGEEKVYLSNADWMDCNFFRRIESALPILDPKLKRRVIREGLKPYLADNCQAWDMDEASDYKRGSTRHCVQDLLLNEFGG